MVVDDEASNLRVVERLLNRAGYSDLRCLSDPLTAERAYWEFRPDVLLLDLHMPGLGGLALLAQLRARTDFDLVPVLVLTGDPTAESIQLALSSGAKDFVAKPFEAAELVLRVENLLDTRFAQLALRDQNDALEKRVYERTIELANAELITLQLLARAAEFRDDDTGRHTQRVGELSAILAHTLGSPANEVDLIRSAAPLHDIGKIGVPDQILLKPGPLTMNERSVMQRHAVIGSEILSAADFPILRAARGIALSHHERWDGSGYPHGLRGEETTQFARIVAVADVFDALRHDRPYRDGLPLPAVVAEITSQAGRHFDPTVVDAFIEVVESGALDGPALVA
jgi:putative two-component system response regulator